MADSIKATPRNEALAWLADKLRGARDVGDVVQIPVLGGLGSMMLGKAPEELTEWSYGNAPITVPQMTNVPQFKKGRADSLTDLIFAAQGATPLAQMAKKGTLAAGRAGERMAERVVPQVMERGGIGAQLMQDLAAGSRSQVVKPKGGNWLAGSVERALEPMRLKVMGYEPSIRLQTIDHEVAQASKAGLDPETMQTFMSQIDRERARLEPDVAMNRWLDTKLAKYIRNEMGTPEDPLRALAERGIIHAEIAPENTYYAPDFRARRRAVGFPEEGMGVSPQARAWELATDDLIHNLPAGERINVNTFGEEAALKALKENPWLSKVPPETMTYGVYPNLFEGQTQFGHLADELRNAINPASGLPENLRWKYQDLEKVTVPQAVQRVADINAWRAAQKAEADAARAMNPATHVFKEYPEQGFKWVELKQPEKTGKTIEITHIPEELRNLDDVAAREMVELIAEDEGLIPGTREFAEYVRDMTPRSEKKIVDESYKALEDALKYEGETMGHCVGGYCPDVIEGRSKIFSLRDKKGQPHVTIEVAPPNKEYTDTDEVVQRFWETHGRDPVNKQELMDFEGLAPEIVQIKGKANRAPNPEYLPAVQDFVRSQNWSNVGDLKNTGLVDLQQIGVPAEMRGGQRFVTEDEYKDIVRKNAEGFAEGGEVHGYQAGGAVKVAKKTMRTLGDMVDEYVRKVRKIEELPDPSYNVTLERPTSAEVPGWHITTDLPGILETGAMTNKNVGGRNLQGYAPEHVGGAYFYADPRLARMKRDELLEMVEMDPLYAAELPILRAQLRRANQMVPDEDVGLNIPWQQSYSEGSFATRRPVLLNQIDRIYSSDPSVTKDMIRDTIIRRRRPGYADGGLVESDPSGANSPTLDFDPARIDTIVGELHALNAG